MATESADTTSQRTSRLEGAYEQTSERLGDLSRGQDALRAETNERCNQLLRGQESLRAETNERYNQLSRGQDALRAEMNDQIGKLRAEMNNRFNVLLLLIGGLWATMIGGFIALFVNS